MYVAGYTYIGGSGVIGVAPAAGVAVGPAIVPYGPAIVPAAPAPVVYAHPPAFLATPSVVAPVELKTLEKSAPASEAKPVEPAPVSEPKEDAPEPAPAAKASDDTVAVDAAPAEAPAPVNPYLPVEDTPEVVAARAQHLAAFQEAQVSSL